MLEFQSFLCLSAARLEVDKAFISFFTLRESHSLISSMDRSGIPPTSLHSPAPKFQISESHHSRSLSQPIFFSIDSLPPLSPSPFRKASPASSISGDPLQPRKIHRRSSSDNTPKFDPTHDGRVEGLVRRQDGITADDLFDTFLNLDGFGAVESSDSRRDEMEMDSRCSGNSLNSACSTESEAESCAVDCSVVGESALDANPSWHSRSISMDGLIGRLINCEGSLRVPPIPGSKRRQSSECDSMDGIFSLEFGNAEFSGVELKKIMADKRLEEIALADPKRAKRILANRHSAARSKERKVQYISELECKVHALQTEITSLSAQLTLLQRNSAGLAAQNNELKIMLHAMEHQDHLRDGQEIY